MVAWRGGGKKFTKWHTCRCAIRSGPESVGTACAHAGVAEWAGPLRSRCPMGEGFARARFSSREVCARGYDLTPSHESCKMGLRSAKQCGVAANDHSQAGCTGKQRLCNAFRQSAGGTQSPPNRLAGLVPRCVFITGPAPIHGSSDNGGLEGGGPGA